MCHLILAMPALALSFFWLWPVAVAAPAYAVVLLLSVVFYVIVIRVMRTPIRAGPESLAESNGEVIGQEHDGGRYQIRLRGELWRATSGDHLEVGDRVEITGRRGLILKVRRAGDGGGSRLAGTSGARRALQQER